jgi:hypothetical protein
MTEDYIETTGSEETGELVSGNQYTFASNIFFLEDTKVKVEDLSDTDIDG